MAKVKESPADVVAESEPAAPVMTAVLEQYEVTTDNPEFTGMTMGVQFINGRALLNRSSYDRRLNRTFEQIVEEMSTLPGYHVTRVQ